MNKLCTFYQLEPGKVRCSSCGRTLTTKYKPNQCHAVCTMPNELSAETHFPEENQKLQCEWQAVVGQPETPEPYHRCIHCGHVEKFQLTTPLYRECSMPHSGRNAVEMPPFLERMANFAASYAEHVRKGSPQSTQEEILESFNVCSPCPYYNDLIGACGMCGCYINLYLATENLNALAWADKECPEKFWLAPLQRRKAKQENLPV